MLFDELAKELHKWERLLSWAGHPIFAMSEGEGGWPCLLRKREHRRAFLADRGNMTGEFSTSITPCTDLMEYICELQIEFCKWRMEFVDSETPITIARDLNVKDIEEKSLFELFFS